VSSRRIFKKSQEIVKFKRILEAIQELAISWKIASEKLAISRKAFFLHHLPNGVRVW